MKTRAEYDGSIRIGTKIDTRDFAAGLKSMVSEAKTASASVVRLLENIARPEKKIKAFLQGFFQGMKEELRGSKVKENVDGIGKALTGLAKKLVIFQLLKQAFSALMKGVKEAFSSYLAADRNLGSSVRDLQASLKTLQGALASAFAPIVEAVVPWLSTMINWLVAGANAVAQFTASLMGKSVYKKASANIAATGAAAGSAANAVDKLNKKLGAYDDLKVIDQDNGSGGSGGGGGAGSTGGGLEYEDVEIDSGISDFADKVKKAWQEADFTEVGTIVGTKLKDALDNINWEGIKATTEKMAKSVATFLNGFIATPGLFDSIGSTIAEGLNTALAFASTFLNTFDFKQFGKAITEGLGGFFSTFKWSELASTLQGWADAGLKFMTGIIQGVDWKNLPQNIIKAIKDFFSGFDFAAHFQAVGEFIGSAVAAGIDLIGAIGKVIGDIGKKIKDYFVEKIQAAGYSSDATLAENGKAIIVGIFNGIVDFFKGIGAWINTNILQPFVAGFKSIFGIHSPADNSQITSLGTNIIEGIFGAIASWFGNIKTWITNNVFNKFKEGWKAVFGEGGLVDTAVSIAVGVVEDAKNWVADAWTALSSAGQTLTSTVQAALTTAANWASDAWTALSSVGQTLTATVSTALQKAQSWAADAWKALGSVGNTLTATVATALTTARSWAADAWTALSGVGKTLTTTVSTVLQKASTWVGDAWSAICAGGRTFTATISAAVEQATKWSSIAWSAITAGGKTLTATIQSAVEQANTWVGVAWSAISAGGKTLTATTLAAVEQATTWVSVAWSAISAGGKTLTATIQAAVEQASTWVGVAWSAISAGGKTLTATTLAAVQQASTWVSTAWSAISAGGKTLTTTINTVVQKATTWIAEAWTAIFSGGKTQTATISTELAQAQAAKWSSAAWTALSAVGKTLAATVDLSLLQKGWSTLKSWILGADATKGYVEVPIKMRTMEDVRGETDAINKLWTLLDKEAKGENVTAEIQTLLKHAKENEWNDFIDLYKQEKPSVTLEVGVSGKKDLEKAAAAWKAFKSGKNSKKATLTATGKMLDKTFTAITKGIAQSEGTNTATLKAKGDDSNTTYAGIARVFNNYGNETTTATLEAVGKKRGNAFENIASAMRAASNGNWSEVVRIMAYVSNALGGAYFGGGWHSISQYASGGIPTHGSMFVAGEAGAEMVGHIGGRTEVLNQSQMAAVMYSSVVNGMAAAIGAVMGHMTECTNAIIANIANLVESADYMASAMPAYAGITGFVPDINRTSGVLSGGMSLDALAEAVSARISGNIQIENVMNMDGRAVYRDMVEIDRQTIRQTGRSGFGR